MSDEVQAVIEEAEEGAPAWVVTFGDLMSLLLCFFVLLLSFSEMDNNKYRVVSGSLKNAFGIQRKKPVFESPRGQKMIAREFDTTFFSGGRHANVPNHKLKTAHEQNLIRVKITEESFDREKKPDFCFQQQWCSNGDRLHPPS